MGAITVKNTWATSKILLASTAMACLGLVGCSNNTATDTNTSSETAAVESETPTEIPATTSTTDNNKSAAGTSIRIAAAANLSDVLPEIIDSYKAEHNLPNQEIEVTFGSSGKLYAQVVAGAPYDLFLSANQTYAEKLASELKSVDPAHKPFTYARGQLALYSVTKPVEPLDKMTLTALLQEQPKSKIAIANPELAPYGESAKAFLQAQNLYDSLMAEKRIIQGENIGQTFQYAHTGNTDYGFVAQSQVTAVNAKSEQFYTLPPDSYPAILQDGLVISAAPVATDFANYLQSAAGQQHFSKAGYLAVTAK